MKALGERGENVAPSVIAIQPKHKMTEVLHCF